MAKLETWYKQDLKRPLVVHKHTDVFNQDSKGNLIGVEVYSDGEPVVLSGSVSGYCLLADGTTVPAVGASRSGNKASVLIPQAAYSVPGPITITIKNVDGDNIVTLCATVGVVRQSVSGNLVNPGSVVTDWSNNINAELQAVQTAADNVGEIVAAPFDENTVYVVGNYVTNNGNLYRITADHAAGVAWASTAKVQCTVEHELEALNKHFIANWNLIDPDAASGNETGFIPVELNVRYNIIHAQSKGRFQYSLSLYDSNKTMLYISQLVDEATDGTNYSYSCTFSQSAIAYVKLKINSAPSGIDTTDFSKVYFGKGSEYIEFDDYNVINAIKKVKDDVVDLADEISDTQSDVSDLRSTLGTVPSGKTVQGQIDDNANDISDLKSVINYDHDMLYSVGTAPSEWEQGMLYASSGGKQTSTNRLRTVSAFFLTDEAIINVNDGYEMQLYGYSGTDSTYYGVWNGSTFEKNSHFFSEPIQTAQLPKTYRYKIVLRYSDETSVTEMPVSEASNCVTYSEKYLPKSSYEADKISYAYDTSKSLTDGMLPHFAFTLGNIGSSGRTVSSTTVCRSTTAVKFDKDTFIRCVNSEYHYGLRRYSGEEIRESNFVDYLGLFEGTYRLKAGTYYVITLSKRASETITDVDEYAKQIEVWSPLYLETMRKYEMKSFAPMGNTRRKIIGHQGNSLHYPGNTIPAFEQAGAGGVWGIETDIQATSDGYLICMHDTTVDRTTDGTGRIASMTMAEIDRLRIKDHPDLKVPTVEQYLGICKTYGCVPCMELKNVASSQEMIAKLLQTITDYGLESTAVILCSSYSIGYVQCINPKIRCIFIIDPTDLETWIPNVQRYFNVSVTMASGTYTVTHEIIKQLHDAGLVVNVGGVNTVEEIKGYFVMGADSVSSDFIATY